MHRRNRLRRRHCPPETHDHGDAGGRDDRRHQPTFVEINDLVNRDIDEVSLEATFVEASDGNPSSTLDTYPTAYGATDVRFDLNPVGTSGQGRNCADIGVPTPAGGVGCTVFNLLSDVYEIDASIGSAWFAGYGIGTIAVFDPRTGTPPAVVTSRGRARQPTPFQGSIAQTRR